MCPWQQEKLSDKPYHLYRLLFFALFFSLPLFTVHTQRNEVGFSARQYFFFLFNQVAEESPSTAGLVQIRLIPSFWVKIGLSQKGRV